MCTPTVKITCALFNSQNNDIIYMHFLRFVAEIWPAENSQAATCVNVLEQIANPEASEWNLKTGHLGDFR